MTPEQFRSSLFALTIAVTLAASPAPVARQDAASPPGERPELIRFVNALMQNRAQQRITAGGMAALLDGNQERIIRFVREEIATEAYMGSYKGAAGTLQSGGGNAWDKALLLKEMLEAAGARCRLVRGRLPAEQAAALLRPMANRPDRLAEFWDTEDRKILGVDEQRWRQAQDRASALRRALVEGIVASARADLERFPAAPVLPSEREQLIAVCQDYLWVQVAGEGDFTDIHPCFPTEAAPSPEPLAYAVSTAALPDDVKYWIRLRLWAERSGLKGGERSQVLEYRALPASISRRVLSLHVVPEPKVSDGPRRVRISMRSGDSLLIDANLDLPGSGGAGETGGLTGLWLEVAVLAPNEAPRIETIVLADAVPAGPAWKTRTAAVQADTPTLPVDDLWRNIDLFIGWPGLPPGQYLENAGRTLRRAALAARLDGAELNDALPTLTAGNPILFAWSGLYAETLRRVWPVGGPVMDGPVILAALHQYRSGAESVDRSAAYRVLFLRSIFTSAEADSRLPGILAAHVLERVVEGTGDAGEAIESATAMVSPLQPAEGAVEDRLGAAGKWDWHSVAELGFDRLRRQTVYLAESSTSPAWWRIVERGHDPLLRGRQGWQETLTAGAELVPTRPISGELLRCQEGGSLNGRADLNRMLAGWFARHGDGNWGGPVSIAAEVLLGEPLIRALERP